MHGASYRQNGKVASHATHGNMGDFARSREKASWWLAGGVHLGGFCFMRLRASKLAGEGFFNQLADGSTTGVTWVAKAAFTWALRDGKLGTHGQMQALTWPG